MQPHEVITQDTLRQVAVCYLAQQSIVANCQRMLHNATHGFGQLQDAKKEMAVQSTKLATLAQELCRQADELECFDTLIVKGDGAYTYWGIKVDYGAVQVVSTFPVEVLLEEVLPKPEESRPKVASILDIVPKGE